MWIVRNTLKAVLRIEGTAVEIRPGEESDLDRHGRSVMEGLAPLAVAFEEGYLENVFKDAESGGESAPLGGDRATDLQKSLEAFKASIMEEIKRSLPAEAQPVSQQQSMQKEFGEVREELRSGVKDVLASLEKMKSQISVGAGSDRGTTRLSDAEVKARLAFLEETEQRLKSNFKSIGQEIGAEDDGPSNVMDNADLLSSI